MELNTLNRLNSVGGDLFKLGEIQQLQNRVRRLKTLGGEPEDAYVGDDEAIHDLVKMGLSKSDIRAIRKGYSLPTKPPAPPSVWRFIYLAARRFGKGFLVGYGSQMAFAAIKGIIKFRGNLGKLFTSLYALRAGTPLSYGLFLGSFLSTFESIVRLFRYTNRGPLPITAMTKKLRGRVRLRAALAAAGASLSLFWLPKSHRLGIALFFFVRAAEIVFKYLGEKGLFPTSEYGDVLVMCLASAQVVWALFFHRHGLDPSYLHFLNHHSGKSAPQLRAFNEIHTGTMQKATYEQLAEWISKNGYHSLPPLEQATAATAATSPCPPFNSLACNILHPTHSSCMAQFPAFFVQGVRRAFSVYLPVYIVPMVLLRAKHTLRNPVSSLLRTFMGVARSTAFLAAYCSIGVTTVCLPVSLGIHSHWGAAFAGFCSGLSLLVEKRSRRVELALYVLSHALQSVGRKLLELGFPKIPDFEVWLFAVSMTVILNTYVNAPMRLKATYFGLLRFFFGSGGSLEKLPASKPSDLALHELEKYGDLVDPLATARVPARSGDSTLRSVPKDVCSVCLIRRSDADHSQCAVRASADGGRSLHFGAEPVAIEPVPPQFP